MNIKINQQNDFRMISSLLEEVQNFHADLFPGVYKRFGYADIRDAMEKMLTDQHCIMFIAMLDEEAIAYLMLIIKEIPENAFHYADRIAHIDQVVVSLKHRKTGVGSLLMEHAEKYAKDSGIKQLELDHLHNNRIASDFFEQKGFELYRSKRIKKIID